MNSRLIFGRRGFLSFRPLRRTRSLARIRERGGDSNAVGRPDRRSQHHSAAEQTSRLLRRQVLRTFEHKLDLNRPSRPLVRPPAINAKLPLICSAAEGCHDFYQASRVCSKRRPVRGFESGTLFGTRVATKKEYIPNRSNAPSRGNDV